MDDAQLARRLAEGLRAGVGSIRGARAARSLVAFQSHSVAHAKSQDSAKHCVLEFVSPFVDNAQIDTPSGGVQVLAICIGIGDRPP
jgi:hypothetical protein